MLRWAAMSRAAGDDALKKGVLSKCVCAPDVSIRYERDLRLMSQSACLPKQLCANGNSAGACATKLSVLLEARPRECTLEVVSPSAAPLAKHATCCKSCVPARRFTPADPSVHAGACPGAAAC